MTKRIKIIVAIMALILASFGVYSIVTGKSVVDIYPGASTEKICADEVRKYITAPERDEAKGIKWPHMSAKLRRCAEMKQLKLL